MLKDSMLVGLAIGLIAGAYLATSNGRARDMVEKGKDLVEKGKQAVKKQVEKIQ
jgi:hypothetical protein